MSTRATTTMTPARTFSITFLIAILAIIASLAFIMFRSIPIAGAATTDGSDLSSTQDSLIDPQDAALLSKIESIKLDETVFTDPDFQSLQDFTIPLGTESAGTSNPFAPFPGSK